MDCIFYTYFYNYFIWSLWNGRSADTVYLFSILEEKFMRSKFLLKISIVLVVVIFFVFGIVMPQYREDYMVALVDKYNYAKEIAAPKVILYGE